MKGMFCVVCCALAIAFAAAGCGKKGQEAGKSASAESAGIAQKLCPVMREPINPKVFVDYGNRRIYFCCNMCPPVFNKDPEKYLKIVDADLKAGTTATPGTK